jgi:hypothetical protein
MRDEIDYALFGVRLFNEAESAQLDHRHWLEGRDREIIEYLETHGMAFKA